MNLSKRHLLGLAVIGAFGLSAPNARAQTLKDVKARGTINVAVLVDFPPFGILNSDNEPDGYDIDVAKGFAKFLGVKLNIVQATGPNRIPYLLSGRVDAVIGSLGINAERLQRVAFSNAYSDFAIAVYGLKSVKVGKPEDLVGKSIGVARASTQDLVVTKVAPAGANIQRFDDDASAVQALLSGQVPLIGCSNTVSAEIEKVAPGKFEVKFALQTQVQGIAFQPGSTELVNAANEYIAASIKDGSLDAIHRKWLGTPAPDVLGQPAKL